MVAVDDIMERWQQLKLKLTGKTNEETDLDAVLLLIGIRESGMPARKFTQTEVLNLREMAVHCLLAPARYYELIWVDDTGWPNYRPLQQLPRMNNPEKEVFLVPYILKYADKNRMAE
jgi:hypothetical protein